MDAGLRNIQRRASFGSWVFRALVVCLAYSRAFVWGDF